MECVRIKISPFHSGVKVKAKRVSPAQTKVCAKAINSIEAKASKVHADTKVIIGGMNAGIKVRAWIICKTNTSRMYLSVAEGWLLTINGEYISVRRA